MRPQYIMISKECGYHQSEVVITTNQRKKKERKKPEK